MKGSELRQLREDRGVRPSWLADRMGLKHRQQLHKIETKKDVSVDEYVAYVSALGHKPGDLLENSVGSLSPALLGVVNELQAFDDEALDDVMQIVLAAARLHAKRTGPARVSDSPKVGKGLRSVHPITEVLGTGNIRPEVTHGAAHPTVEGRSSRKGDRQ